MGHLFVVYIVCGSAMTLVHICPLLLDTHESHSADNLFFLEIFVCGYLF